MPNEGKGKRGKQKNKRRIMWVLPNEGKGKKGKTKEWEENNVGPVAGGQSRISDSQESHLRTENPSSNIVYCILSTPNF
jgi:hypothetical protein